MKKLHSHGGYDLVILDDGTFATGHMSERTRDGKKGLIIRNPKYYGSLAIAIKSLSQRSACDSCKDLKDYVRRVEQAFAGVSLALKDI